MPSTGTLFLCVLYASQYYNGLVDAYIEIHSAAYCSDKLGNGITEDALMCGDDSFMVANNGIYSYSGVFDGLTDGPNSFEISQGLAKKCEKFAKEVKNSDSTSILLSAQKEMKEEEFKNGATTALTLGINTQSGKLHATNYGDSGFAVIRNGKVVQQSKELIHSWRVPYQLDYDDDIIIVKEDNMVYTLDLLPADIIVLATDGLWNNLFLDDIIALSKESLVEASNKKDVSEYLAKKLVEKSQLFGKAKSYKSPFVEKWIEYANTHYTDNKRINKLNEVKHTGKLDDTTVVVHYISEPKGHKMAGIFSETHEADIINTYCNETRQCYQVQQNIRCFKLKSSDHEVIECGEILLDSFDREYEKFLEEIKPKLKDKTYPIERSNVPEKKKGATHTYCTDNDKEGRKCVQTQQIVECFEYKTYAIKEKNCEEGGEWKNFNPERFAGLIEGTLKAKKYKPIKFASKVLV